MPTTQVNIPDEFRGEPVESYDDIPAEYIKALDTILIPDGKIKSRVKRLARDIHEDYVGEGIHIICIQKGAGTFCGDLMYRLAKANVKDYSRNVNVTRRDVTASSYKNQESTGNVSQDSDNFEDARGKNILIVEDIVDSSLTMVKLIEFIRKYDPKTVKVATLLDKRVPRTTGFVPDYIGFSVPAWAWVVGYGMDYNEKYRDIFHIATLNDLGKQNGKI